jgi:hypothetical protein
MLIWKPLPWNRIISLNLRLDPLEPGNVAMPIIKSRHDSADDGEILRPMPVIDPSELIGRTFLMDKEDGQRHHA